MCDEKIAWDDEWGCVCMWPTRQSVGNMGQLYLHCDVLSPPIQLTHNDVWKNRMNRTTIMEDEPPTTQTTRKRKISSVVHLKKIFLLTTWLKDNQFLPQKHSVIIVQTYICYDEKKTNLLRATVGGCYSDSRVIRAATHESYNVPQPQRKGKKLWEQDLSPWFFIVSS